MNNKNTKVPPVLLLTCIASFSGMAQISPELIRQYADNNNSPRSSGIRELYNRLHYQAAWINKENEYNRTVFFESLTHAADMGLSEKDYNGTLIQGLRKGTLSLQTLEDSMQAEIAITDAAIHFYTEIAYGNLKPPLSYNGIDYVPACRNIPVLIADGISQKSLASLPRRLSPLLPVTIALEKKIKRFNQVMADSSFKEVALISNKINGSNGPLVTKLYQLGLLDTDNKKPPDSILKQKVKEAQRLFSLLPDGVLRSTIIQELIVPVSARLRELNLSLNYYRWLYCLIQNQHVIVVNLPSAYMKVYNDGAVKLEMRMVVGKTSTPTSTLSSRVTEVVLYPYWHVPHSIATRELLPLIKRNPGYINAGNYQVLNKAGNIVNPYSVNWHSLSPGYFPYLIRQSTGCDNALGLLKLNFYSPFGIYLHDTPVKALFKLNKRYFSHGCMRMEKPMELGHLILKNNRIAIDTLEQKGCLRNQSPVHVPAVDSIPVIVWYNPVDIDVTGRIIFYDDVYNKFAWLRGK